MDVSNYFFPRFMPISDSIFPWIIAKKIKHAEARDGTPLAVTVANNKAYLYYVTARNELEKIVKSDISNPKSWGSNDTIKTSKKVHAESQITVVAAGGQNHIFFASGADGKVFEHVIDAW